jgi:uncharacterized protein YyaL (SSP411 family)
MQTARTLCHAYEVTGNNNFLQLAEKLVEAARGLFDSEHGGFSDTIVDPRAPGFLSKPVKPLDDNSLAAQTLVKLHHLTGEESYRKMAKETLERFAGLFHQFSFMAADYALAVDAFLNEPTMIRIIGSLEKTQAKELLTEAHRIYEPRKIIQVLNPNRDSEQILKLGYSITAEPKAYVCLGKLCTSPITEPKQIAPELARMITVQSKR